MEIVALDPRIPAALERFTAVARAVYAGDPVWASASETTLALHWTRCAERPTGLFQPVIVLVGDRPVARAAAILPEGSVDAAGAPQGYIGYVECLAEYPEAAGRLLHYCERLLWEAGARSVQAPKADNQLFGCQTGGFELPHLCLTPHNPPRYRRLFEPAGYAVTQHVHAFTFTRETAGKIPLFLGPGRIRAFDLTRLDDEIRIFHQLQPSVFGDRPGYVPRTLAEDRDMIEALLPFIDPDLIVIAEDAEGQAIGILACLPDFYQSLAGEAVDRARVISVGVLPGYVKAGVGTRMAAALMKALIGKEQYRYVEASLILAENTPPHALANRFGARTGREFVLFQKAP